MHTQTVRPSTSPFGTYWCFAFPSLIHRPLLQEGYAPRGCTAITMISTILPLLSTALHTHPLLSLLALLLGIPLSYLLINEYVRHSVRLKGFPGPRNWPLVGNIPDIKFNAAETYRQWAKTYGDVYQIQLGNVPVIVVNSAEAARKIFGQHSQALSSRPVFWTFHKVYLNHWMEFWLE